MATENHDLIERTVVELSKVRSVFHSEADFQHAFAWELHNLSPDLSIRLEYKPPQIESRIYLDIWASGKDASYAIELKYKTRMLRVEAEETFHLLNQSAQDVGRYDFLKDIQRLEQIVVARSNTTGYAILLTNDPSYWNPSKSNATVDASFRIHQGQTIKGEVGWGQGASKGTMKSREDAVVLKGTYVMDWKDYSAVDNSTYGKFKYLLIKVMGLPS